MGNCWGFKKKNEVVPINGHVVAAGKDLALLSDDAAPAPVNKRDRFTVGERLLKAVRNVGNNEKTVPAAWNSAEEEEYEISQLRISLIGDLARLDQSENKALVQRVNGIAAHEKISPGASPCAARAAAYWLHSMLDRILMDAIRQMDWTGDFPGASELLSAACASCSELSAHGSPNTARQCIYALCEMLRTLHVHHSACVPKAEWVSPCLVELVHSASHSLLGEGIISPSDADRRMTRWLALLGGIGLLDPIQHSYLLDSHAKAVFLCSESYRQGVRKLPMTVDRAAVLDAAQSAFAKAKKLSKSKPSGFILFPVYRKHTGGPNSVEEGEGHGPRKELFELASAELASKWGMSNTVHCAVTAEADSNVVRSVAFGSFIGLGHQLLLPEADSSQHLDCTVTQRLSHESVRVDRLFTASISAAAFQYRSKHVQLLVPDPEDGMCWLNPALQNSTSNQAAYELLGWLMAQAIINRTSLHVRLPRLLFKWMFAQPTHQEYRPSFADLKEFGVTTARTQEQIMKASKTELQAILEAEGLALTMSNHAYADYVAQELVNSVAWQLECIGRGFALVLDLTSDLIQQLRIDAGVLQHLIVGSSMEEHASKDFSWREHFRVVEDEELIGTPQLRCELWDYMDSLEVEEKYKLLHFITGRSRLPISRTETLLIELPFDELFDDLSNMLPCAQTCANTLQLPNYWAALSKMHKDLSDAALQSVVRETLRHKMAMAVAETSGYGLDDGVVSHVDASDHESSLSLDSMAPSDGAFSASEHLNLHPRNNNLTERAPRVAVDAPDDEVTAFDASKPESDKPMRVAQLSSGSWMLGNAAHHANTGQTEDQWELSTGLSLPPIGVGLPPIGERSGVGVQHHAARTSLDEDIANLLQSLEDDE